MQFPYVHICAILSDDRINDRAVKPFITKEVQERDVKSLASSIRITVFKTEESLFSNSCVMRLIRGSVLVMISAS